MSNISGGGEDGWTAGIIVVLSYNRDAQYQDARSGCRWLSKRVSMPEARLVIE